MKKILLSGLLLVGLAVFFVFSPSQYAARDDAQYPVSAPPARFASIAQNRSGDDPTDSADPVESGGPVDPGEVAEPSDHPVSGGPVDYFEQMKVESKWGMTGEVIEDQTINDENIAFLLTKTIWDMEYGSVALIYADDFFGEDSISLEYRKTQTSNRSVP